MAEPDTALDALREIIVEFKTFLAARGAVSEADTRVKLIDRILIEVCGWPEQAIAREEHVNRGFIDYSLSIRARRYVAVEAKKHEVAFTLPGTTARTLKLNGSLVKDKSVKEAIEQVRGYCDDAGIRYAVATNGDAWIIFRAIREDLPWREGNARIFPSLDYIENNFTDFWNLVSFEAIERGNLDDEFGASTRVPRGLHRVVDRLFNSDLPLERNRLHAQLHPLIQTIFQDIADQDPVEILQSCYVHAESLKIVANDLNIVIIDAIPRFLVQEGAEAIRQEADDAGSFGAALQQAPKGRPGQLYLVLGGIGSGKTTFIKRYQRTVGKTVLDSRGLWFHLDFLEAPVDPSGLERFAWEGILQQLRTRYVDKNLETRRNIKKCFAEKTQIVGQAAGLFRLPAGAFDKEISTYLQRWQEDANDYAPRLLQVAKSDRELNTVLFLDNVDQLSPTYQAQVFVLAERMTRIIGSVTVLALREESYYAASVQKTLTAYTRDDQKLERTEKRASRVRLFLHYLSTEEDWEQKEFDLQRQGGIWSDAFVPAITEQIEREIAWILRRLKENRERYADDIRVASEKDDAEILGADDGDVDTSATYRVGHPTES